MAPMLLPEVVAEPSNSARLDSEPPEDPAVEPKDVVLPDAVSDKPPAAVGSRLNVTGLDATGLKAMTSDLVSVASSSSRPQLPSGLNGKDEVMSELSSLDEIPESEDKMLVAGPSSEHPSNTAEAEATYEAEDEGCGEDEEEGEDAEESMAQHLYNDGDGSQYNAESKDEVVFHKGKSSRSQQSRSKDMTKLLKRMANEELLPKAKRIRKSSPRTGVQAPTSKGPVGAAPVPSPEVPVVNEDVTMTDVFASRLEPSPLSGNPLLAGSHKSQTAASTASSAVPPTMGAASAPSSHTVGDAL